jgi:hypothetical protein
MVNCLQILHVGCFVLISSADFLVFTSGYIILNIFIYFLVRALVFSSQCSFHYRLMSSNSFTVTDNLFRLSMTESELTLAESKVNELNRQLLLIKEERGQTDKLHQNELKHEREVSSSLLCFQDWREFVCGC